MSQTWLRGLTLPFVRLCRNKIFSAGKDSLFFERRPLDFTGSIPRTEQVFRLLSDRAVDKGSLSHQSCSDLEWPICLGRRIHSSDDVCDG